MDLRSLLADPKVIAALIAGVLAIVAAYIRRDKRLETTRAKKPVLRLLGFPLLYLLLGAGMLAAEFFYANAHKTGDPGALLIFGGWVFAVAGVTWLPINVVRLAVWPKSKDSAAASTSVRSAPVQSAAAPAGAIMAPPPGGGRGSALVQSTAPPGGAAGGGKSEKPRAKRPVLRLLGFPLLSLLIAAGLAAAVYFRLVVDSKDAGQLNRVALVQLAACLFGAAGVVWLPVNVVRLLAWPRPTEPSAAAPTTTKSSQPPHAPR